MKKTRNLFILVGASDSIAKALTELQFKGSVVVNNPIGYSSAQKIFGNNKSIICSSELAGFEHFHDNPTYVEVVSDSSHTFQNYIDVSAGNISAQFQDIATRLNLDIGDHKSNSSGLNGAPSVKTCVYCKVFNGELNDTILYKSKYFYILTTVGEFITGYLLIIPEKHVMSTAELSDDERAELIDVIEDMKYILNLTYNHQSFLVWENGTGNSGIGKAKDSIVHSHVHLAPSHLDIMDIQKVSGLSFDKICYADIPKYSKDSYLLIAGNDYNTWYINSNPDVYIPRQFVRQILAEEHGITGEAWNWRLFPFYNLMHKTEIDFMTAIKDNWDTLPERIKEYTKDYLTEN